MKEELDLARNNHDQVINELQKMKDDSNYVSEWTPKTIEEYRAEFKAEKTKDITSQETSSHNISTVSAEAQTEALKNAIVHNISEASESTPPKSIMDKIVIGGVPQFEDNTPPINKNEDTPPLNSAEDMTKYRSSAFDGAVHAKYLDENDYAMPTIVGHRRMMH